VARAAIAVYCASANGRVDYDEIDRKIESCPGQASHSYSFATIQSIVVYMDEARRAKGEAFVKNTECPFFGTSP
jgi:hypothetical protein